MCVCVCVEKGYQGGRERECMEGSEMTRRRLSAFFFLIRRLEWLGAAVWLNEI